MAKSVMPTSATYQLTGRLDGSTSAATEQALQALFSPEVNSLDVDISGLDFVSSAGLRVLLVLAKTAKARGGKLVLHGPKPAILEVFKISGFDRIIAIAA